MECVHYVVLFQTETTRDGVIWMEHAVTTETMGLPAGMSDIDIFTVLTGDFGVTEDALYTQSVMYTCEGGRAHHTLVLLLSMYTQIGWFTFFTDGLSLSMMTCSHATARDTLLPNAPTRAYSVSSTLDTPVFVPFMGTAVGPLTIITTSTTQAVLTYGRAVALRTMFTAS